ncbi:anti-sigma factor [Gloeocapsa sp. PCC 73106]|uniref:anti-sigma factor family protein n=1 Tax=Gloeocapsa sp. PCC 73106 TaxID=102232 RepID=UPI0002AC0731|nr:hypothetical protein [Gloeocapsa sp. PCC 73106]ELR96770.1 hypothetical protein GLO73106DRAFT_00005690 [Gloeocapsa sp. PCC 73106]
MMPDFDPSEHFELLSAYIDQELSEEETTKIKSLLQNDQRLQHEYQQMLRLRAKLKNLPQPSPIILPEQLAAQVLNRVKQQERKRSKWGWSGGAIAALSVAALSGLFTPIPSRLPQLANSSDQDAKFLVMAINQVSREQMNSRLMIPLNQPLAGIPK